MKKRILACLLALVMLIGVMPVAMAAEAETDGTCLLYTSPSPRD